MRAELQTVGCDDIANIQPMVHLGSMLIDFRLAAISLALFGAVAASAEPATKADTLDRINRECNLPSGELTLVGEDVQFQPPANEPMERFGCAMDRLKAAGLQMGFVGNEADPGAKLDRPLNYIARGSQPQIVSLIKAALTDNWIVVRKAVASDKTYIVELASPGAMTHAGADRLLERIWKKEFGDIAFGMSPRNLSDTDLEE